MSDERTLSIPDVCRRARQASRALGSLPPQARDRALRAIAEAVERAEPEVLAENRADVERARASGMAEPLVDRLLLTPARVKALARSVLDIAAQPDPVGEVVGMVRRPNGLLVGQVRVPLGVVAMIYEARPNVTVDAAALCLKSGNASLLRGGSDARSSNAALGRVVSEAVAKAGLPGDVVQVLPPLDQDQTRVLLGQTGLIDLVIPRGGERLIRFVTEHARVPVIQHFKGVCHLYVDEGADLAMALALLENGKAQRPGTCNATECLLVHRAEAERFLPDAGRRMAELGVEVRGCPRTTPLVPTAKAAADADWGEEFLGKVLAVRVVDGFDGALEHIGRYGSGHTEAICTRSYERSQRFLREVDASCVLVNASTRFNDGGELGLGAEIGISTSKLHAYGPMGAQHLTTCKWIVYGEGQIRALRPTVRQGTYVANARKTTDLKNNPPLAKTSAAVPAVTGSKQARERAILAASAGLEKKALDVEIIDVAGRVDYADYLVLMTGTSDRHVASLVQGIEEDFRKRKVKALSVEGLPQANWVLVDFGDIVIHVFQEDARGLYDIEGLWMDANRIPVPERAQRASTPSSPPSSPG